MVAKEFQKLTKQQVDVLAEALEVFREKTEQAIEAADKTDTFQQLAQLKDWKTVTELLEMLWR